METAETREKTKASWLPLAQLLACYALFDFFAPGMVSSWRASEPSLVFVAIWLFICGSLLGQCGALAVWGSLGPGSASLRWTACLLAAMGLACLVLGGLPLFTGNRAFPASSVKTLLVLPTALLCAQIPLWILRLGWGYHVSANARQPPTQQFSLRELLLATTIIAIASACLRAGAASSLAAGGWALGGLAFAALVVLPALQIAFRAPTNSRGVLTTTAYVAVGGLVGWIGAKISGSKDAGDVVFSVAIALGGTLAVLQGSLVYLKAQGYTLRRAEVESPGVE